MVIALAVGEAVTGLVRHEARDSEGGGWVQVKADLRVRG